MPIAPDRDRSTEGQRKIRDAVVGLGWIAQEDVSPAFGHTENSELVALISDDPTKQANLSQQYGAFNVRPSRTSPI